MLPAFQRFQRIQPQIWAVPSVSGGQHGRRRWVPVVCSVPQFRVLQLLSGILHPAPLWYDTVWVSDGVGSTPIPSEHSHLALLTSNIVFPETQMIMIFVWFIYPKCDYLAKLLPGVWLQMCQQDVLTSTHTCIVNKLIFFWHLRLFFYFIFFLKKKREYYSIEKLHHIIMSNLSLSARVLATLIQFENLLC